MSSRTVFCVVAPEDFVFVASAFDFVAVGFGSVLAAGFDSGFAVDFGAVLGAGLAADFGVDFGAGLAADFGAGLAVDFVAVLGAGFAVLGVGFGAALAVDFGAALAVGFDDDFAVDFWAPAAALAVVAGAGFFTGAGLAEPAFPFDLEAGDLAEEAAFLVDMDGRDEGRFRANLSHYSANGPGSDEGGNYRGVLRRVKD